MGFREENRLLIWVSAFFGMYMRSFETVTSNKWTRAFFTVWTKLPMSVFPFYIAFDLRSLLFDGEPLKAKIAMVRKIIAFGVFFLKNIFFYLNRGKIESLFDRWDASFQEEFYPREQVIYTKYNIEANKRLIRLSFTLAIVAALFYSVPAYFSKAKKFSHPTGIQYPPRSPEFDIVVTFDVVCSLAAISAAAMDCVLCVLLSYIRSKLEFLRDTLTDLINELAIDADGRLLGRQIERLRSYSGRPELYSPQTQEDFSMFSMAESGNPFDDSNYEETEPGSERFRKNIRDVESKLKIWILHHQQTISMFDELKQVFSSMATIELGYIVLYTSLTALQLVQVRPGPVVLGVALVASSSMMSLFFWSKLGAELEAIHLFRDGFGRAWFLFPKKIKTAFSFIITRSEKPMRLYGITVYGINLVTFFEILKLSYQFFAFMVQLTD